MPRLGDADTLSEIPRTAAVVQQWTRAVGVAPVTAASRPLASFSMRQVVVVDDHPSTAAFSTASIDGFELRVTDDAWEP
jgi:hypothetical protein